MDLIIEHLSGLEFDRSTRNVVGAVLALILLALVVRRAIRGGRPDDWLAAVSAVLAFGWTASAVWDIATDEDRLNWPAELAVALVAVFEVMLTVAYLRARRRYKVHKNAGRHGQTMWTIAATMAVLASLSAHSASEAVIRFAIPLLAARQLWDGMIGDDDVVKDKDATTWRITPRRVLLWLRFIEPGDRDAIAIDRDRQVAQITNLEFRRRHGWSKLAGRRTMRLAKLALTADDALLDTALARVERAERFAKLVAVEPADEPPTEPEPPVHPVPPVQPEPPIVVEPAKPAPKPEPEKQRAKPTTPARTGLIKGRRVPVPNGATVIDDRIVDGEELRRIARDRYLLGGRKHSQRGLAGSFDPPMSQPWAKERMDEVEQLDAEVQQVSDGVPIT